MTRRGSWSEALDDEACLAMIRRARVGTVLFSHRALPAGVPVHYAVDGDDLVFRVSTDTPEAKATDDAVVGMHVQDLDLDAANGWYVTATGVARWVGGDDVERASHLAIAAWRGEDPTIYVRFVPARFTGRSLGLVRPGRAFSSGALAAVAGARERDDDRR